MIKCENDGQRTCLEVSGSLQELLVQVSYIISGLNEKIPTPLLKIAIQIGLEEDAKKLGGIGRN